MKLKFSGQREPPNIEIIQQALNSIPDERCVSLERDSGVFFLSFDEKQDGRIAITSMPLAEVWLNDPLSAKVLELAVNRFASRLVTAEK